MLIQDLVKMPSNMTVAHGNKVGGFGFCSHLLNVKYLLGRDTIRWDPELCLDPARLREYEYLKFMAFH